MAYIITKENFHHFLSALGDPRVHNLPRYLVLSKEEESLYRLESLERWLARNGKNANNRNAKSHTARSQL